MKKGELCLVMCMLLLSGCAGSQLKFNKKNVSCIEFTTRKLHYEIKKEKIPTIIDTLNQMEIDEQIDVKSHQSSWSIIVHEQNNYIYWLNKGGSIIRQVWRANDMVKTERF